MFPSSAIQIVEQTQSRLVILDPPDYVLGSVILCFGLAGLVAVGLFFLFSRNINAPLALLASIPLLAFLCLGLYLLTGRTRVILSRNDGLLTLENQHFGLSPKQQSMPLDQIRRGVVETIRFNRRVVLVLRSGETVPLGDASNRDGYYAAADAINDFLGVPSQQ